MVDSKSTDKLQIICETIEKKILSDEQLKTRVSRISIVWDSIVVGDGDKIACPRLEVELK